MLRVRCVVGAGKSAIVVETARGNTASWLIVTFVTHVMRLSDASPGTNSNLAVMMPYDVFPSMSKSKVPYPIYFARNVRMSLLTEINWCMHNCFVLLVS